MTPGMVKSSDGTRLDRQIAFVIGAIIFGLLLRNVARDLLPGDSGEFQFAAWRWGLAHATGYPLYLLVGGLWQRLWSVLAISPAFALNALSAVFASITVALLYLLGNRWLPGPPVVRRLAAGLAAAMFAANPTLRSQSLAAEVYTLHALFVVAILLAAQRLAEPGDVVADATGRRFTRRLVTLALLLGLAFTHHATTLLLIPPLLIYFWLASRPPYVRAWHVRKGLWAALAFLLPQLLYLYIPLRGGPDASPWYHQRLGDGTLALYTNTWQSFVRFISGQSISVGFSGVDQAYANTQTAILLWARHFEWPGLLLMGAGVVVLVRMRAWPILGLTVSYLVLHQFFNLFYAIGDIFVYYIPLYLVACIWIGFGAAGIGTAFRVDPVRAGGAGEEAEGGAPGLQRLAPVLVVVLFWLPLQLWTQYTPLMERVQTESSIARANWEAILAAQPPDDAILVSNDRNEIVPLFYLQAVEGRGLGHTGLFPLIAPDARFADIGATVQTALDAGDGQPVYLIKAMPDLRTRFALRPHTVPLVEITGAAAATPPTVRVDQVYGPLRLLGYDWARTADQVQIDLHWQVDAALPADYTTTVQLFDDAGNKLAQDDRQAGGDYYPTSHWKPGETLLDRHMVDLPSGGAPVQLLVGMYAGPLAVLLAPPLELPFPPPN